MANPKRVLCKLILHVVLFSLILDISRIAADENAKEIEKTRRKISNLKSNSKHNISKIKRAAEGNSSDEAVGPTPGKGKINLKMKFEPFNVPKGYNSLQMPTFAFVAAQAKDFSGESLFGVFDLFPFEVTVSLRVLAISDLDEKEEEVTYNADLIVQWKDEVIADDTQKKVDFDSSEEDTPEAEALTRTLDQDVLKNIWKPDVYIEKLVKVQHPEVMSQAVTVRINQLTGRVTYVSRMRIIMECEMDFHYYPADTQSCRVTLRSNSYSDQELSLEWAEPLGVYLRDCGGPNYDFQIANRDDSTYDEKSPQNKTRSYSILTFDILARRKLSYHMVQTYLPSIFFIVITWLCFLVPSRMVEARIGISMTTLLTLTAMFASVRESTPSVSYVRALDIWMIACIFFVFLTLLEFTVLVWLRNMKEELDNAQAEEKKRIENEQTNFSKENLETSSLTGGEKSEGTDYVDFRQRSGSHAKKRQKAELQHNISEFIERFAFLIFSVIFILFSLVYWSWLLIGSGYFDWDVDKKLNECVDK